MDTITAIIQARTGSTRLPGKTLMTIQGRSLLGHLVTRVKATKNINDIIIATTTNRQDDDIVRFATGERLKLYRGSEEDVLDRFYQAATEYRVGTIVRITPDCPMLDPAITDLVISHYLKGSYDYVSNAIRPTYPDGLDTEVFSFQTLEKAWQNAKLPSEREHVTAYIVKRPKIFRLFNVSNDGEDLSWMRWTVDTEQDLQFVKRIFAELYVPGKIFYMEDVVTLLQKNPDLLKINQGISRNEGYRLSLSRDEEG
jgi:spore coat polysaccharide biosynthesis protein SpsF